MKITSLLLQVTQWMFSCLAYTDFSTGKQRNTGVVFDDFSIIYEDVEAYVKYSRELGFKNIILAGHSLGSNKIINYLGNTNENLVDYFIVSSPVDLTHWWKVMPNMDLCLETAKKFVDEGKGKDILPFLFGGFSPMCAETVLSFYNAFNLKNCRLSAVMAKQIPCFNTYKRFICYRRKGFINRK
ncbi:MAG: DUF1749 domain-containing protein [Candidatus Gastranaerophilaceae bacterium]